MGTNSTDALNQAFHDFLKRCQVVNGVIITPLDEPYDSTAGGLKLPTNPKFDGTTDQGTGSKRDQ